MLRAIELAADHHTHPNPRVGAVIVSSDGAVIGEGAHFGVGSDHAEVVALRQAGSDARGATLYVTLEPCVHHGNTPPCTDAILEAGVANVFVAVQDPDERVSGSGVYILKQGDVNVEVGLEAEASLDLDRAYFHHRTTSHPWVTMKYAMTVDGSIAAIDGSSKWITSEEARADAHQLRSSVDAVVVGAGTLRSDNPLLDARGEYASGHQPRPVVIAGAQPLPPSARIWQRNPLVLSTRAIEIPGGEVAVVPGDQNHPYPEAATAELGERGLIEILVEGGADLIGSWLRAGVIDRGILYLGARMGGGKGVQPIGGEFASISDSREITITDVRSLGPDLRVEFE
jgi:diaminohydroxyphosphoribosylaminopyrimidine deaminase/5-amino-6-(5-phosphoribosylamino)uracil reductase